MTIHPSAHAVCTPPGSVLLSPYAVRVLADALDEFTRLHRTYEPTKHLRPDAEAVIARVTGLSRTAHASRDEIDAATELPDTGDVDTAAAARLLGITTGGVRRRIYAGRIAAHHDGKSWRIPRHQLPGAPTR